MLGIGLSIWNVTLGGGSSPPVVEDQAISFGALTLSGAGGIIPTHTGVITSASITSGDASSHWQIAADGTITPTAAGDTANLNLGPYTLGVSFNGGVDTATVTVNITASAYSAATMAEAKAAAAAIGVGGGVSILLRSGTYAEDTAFLQNRAFTSTITITKHTGATPIFSQIDCNNSDNLVIDGLTFTRGGGIPLYIRNASDTVTVQNCLFYGTTPIDPLGDYSAVLPVAPTYAIANDGTTAPANVSIRNNEFHDVLYGINLSCTGALRIEGNYLHEFFYDGAHLTYVAGNTSVVFSDNVFTGPISNSTDFGNPHSDFIQFVGDAVSDWEGISILRNIFVAKYARAFTEGIFMRSGLGGYFSGTIVKGNLIINRFYETLGIRIMEAENAVIIGNTIASTTLLTGTGPAILIGEDASSGAHTVINNAADAITVAGSQAGVLNNIILGSAGATIPYATAFDGPTFAPTTRAEALSMYSMKVGGPLDLAVNVGAVGSGYVTWPTTSPGNNGSLDASYESNPLEFMIPGSFINESAAGTLEWMTPSGAYVNE
jgi:hypothetical protein